MAKPAVQRVSLLLLLSVAGAVGLGQVPEPAGPATRPDAVSALDVVGLWVNGLNDPDAAVRVRSAEALGRLGPAGRAAVGPLLGLLAARFEASGLMRVVADPAAVATTSRPDELADYHARQITSGGFLAETLANPLARQWKWVRLNLPDQGQPVELVEPLRESLSAGAVGSTGDVELRLVAADGEAASEMLNLLMAIYQRHSALRSEQRRQRAELDEKLAAAEKVLAARQKDLDDFQGRTGFAEVQRQYEDAVRRADPIVRQRDRLRREQDQAWSDLRDLEREEDLTSRALDMAAQRFALARQRLDNLRSNPTEPRAEWQRQVNEAQDQVDQLQAHYRRFRRDLDRVRAQLDRTRDIYNRARDRLEAVLNEIRRIMGDLEERHAALASQFKPLAAAVQDALSQVQSLQTQSAKLPSMSELAGASSSARLHTRAGTPIEQSQPARVRLAAVRALAGLGDQRAVKPLVQVLADGNESVRRSAGEALAKLTGQDFGTDQARWRAWVASQPAGSQPDSSPPGPR